MGIGSSAAYKGVGVTPTTPMGPCVDQERGRRPQSTNLQPDKKRASELFDPDAPRDRETVARMRRWDEHRARPREAVLPRVILGWQPLDEVASLMPPTIGKPSIPL